MNVKRGEVYNARFPHASGGRGKKRPVVVVQADAYNRRLRHAVVVQLTTNLSDRNDPACLFLDATASEGQAAGIEADCLLSGYLMSLLSADRLTDRIGELSATLMTQVDDCIKAALGVP